ncbi:MAG TPA: GNAT family N-acetyltransferase [Nocardioidaceae bacterium]|nr:GNAT family N-acetyltransferase [Nocardioidaceae bacterium]
MPADYYIRPMRPDDVAAVERLTAEGFYDIDVRTRRPGWPEPTMRADAKADSWRRRMHHLLTHDPGGCWVADDDTGVIGVAVALKRDLTWILATFVVRPGLQGRGVGKQLLDAALSYGDGCLRGMLAASEDPRAARRYRLADFTLHPTMFCRGRVARDLLPVVERVRDGSSSDIDLINSVDRQVRDAAHGVDHELLSTTHQLVVVERSTGSGYAYVEPGGGPYLLAATNRRTATDLLWETLAASSPDEPCTIGHISAPNEWAIDVGMAARLELHTSGYLGLRGMKPPMPYLPSGHFL